MFYYKTGQKNELYLPMKMRCAPNKRNVANWCFYMETSDRFTKPWVGVRNWRWSWIAFLSRFGPLGLRVVLPQPSPWNLQGRFSSIFSDFPCLLLDNLISLNTTLSGEFPNLVTSNLVVCNFYAEALFCGLALALFALFGALFASDRVWELQT